jgi:hypothetical protein
VSGSEARLGLSAALLVLGLGVTRDADAQSFLYRPATPSTGVSAFVDARYQRVADFVVSDLEVGQLGLTVEGRVRLHPHFELGAHWGAGASVVALDGLRPRTRAGAAPLGLFVGTGGTLDAWDVGLRLIGGVSFAALGAEDLSSNGDSAFAELELALATRSDDMALELRVGLGASYAGDTAVSGIVRTAVGLDLGSSAWPLRPFLGATLAHTTDMGPTGELLVGGSARPSGEGLVRFGVGLTPFRDPTGNVVRVWVGGNLGS